MEADSLPSSADPSEPENKKPEAEMPAAVEHSSTEKDSTKGISSSESAENNKQIEPSEVKHKNTKRNTISEEEFLELTLKYQQLLAERNSAIAAQDKPEASLELQKDKEMLMIDRNYLLPVMDQGRCNCCYDIAIAECIATKYAIDTRRPPVKLSVQHLVDYIPDFFNYKAGNERPDITGCYKSSTLHVFSYIIWAEGICYERDYPFEW